MERRLAIHAGPHQPVTTAARQVARRASAGVLATLVLASGTTMAAPGGAEARAEFDRGVAAYSSGDYAQAASALGASYALEADEETLFAWAQAERRLDHCDKAVELYTKLLEYDLPEVNKLAIGVQIEECNDILAKRPPATTNPVEPPPPTEAPAPAPPPPAERRAWWKDPIGGALVGAGAVGLVAGTVLLVQGNSADTDKESATTYDEYRTLADRAESRGRLGVIAMVAGGALVTGGVVWYATRKPRSEERTLSGWIAPSGGGLVLGGRF